MLWYSSTFVNVRIADLCCGGGGASWGYHLAFPDAQITGVDLKPQVKYPFKFIQADALEFDVGDFDLVHVSPPCQAYTGLLNGHSRGEHRETIHLFRAHIEGRPYVIENVVGARKHLRNPVCLTGGFFGLGVHRPRLFETSFLVKEPPYQHVHGMAVYGRGDNKQETLEKARDAMGIPWMDWREITQAIPPAYTHYLGLQFQNQPEVTNACLWCGVELSPNKTRPFRYCSRAHKQRAWRHRIDP